MISLAFIQFCTIVLYCFFTFTCHCNVVSMLQMGRQKIMKFLSKKNDYQLQNVELLTIISERTHDHTKFQSGIVSDDFQ